MTMTPGTRSKLDYTKRILVREFNHLPHEEVVHEIETVTDSLLEAARFDHYIPILAHRFACDRLRLHEPREVVRMTAEAA